MHFIWNILLAFYLLTLPIHINSSLQEPLKVSILNEDLIAPPTTVKICPPSSLAELIIATKYSNLDCYFPHLFENEDYKCSSEVKPQAYEYIKGEFLCRTYQYSICSATPKIIYKREVIDIEFAVVFIICGNRENPEDTVYTVHKISEHKLEMQGPEIKIFDDYQSEYTQNAVDELYEKIYKIENKDNLKPQMLMPSRDISYNLGRGINYEKINIQLQWESLTKIWNAVNKYVWLVEKIEKKAFQHTIGTTGELKIGENPIRVGKNVDQRIPKYWWRLIHDSNQHAILIILHNQPLGTKHIDNYLCGDSTCNNYYWDGITEIAKTGGVSWLYCCEVNEDNIKALNLPKLFTTASDVLEVNWEAALFIKKNFDIINM